MSEDKPMTKKEYERRLLLDCRDPHAHARIDQLQKQVAFLLGSMTGGTSRGEVHAAGILHQFKVADEKIERQLGLTDE